LGDILNAALIGFGTMFEPVVFFYMATGIFIGMFFGLIPGLSGLSGMGLLLPFAIGHPPEVAFSFLLGMYAVTTQTDAIPAILIGVPGTSAAQATYLDGYPMAKNGEAGRALSASYFSSIWGTLIFTILFIIILPFIRTIISSFAAPEYFMMAVLGLVLSGTLVGPNISRGMCLTGFGLLLSTIEVAGSTGDYRFTFGWNYLEDGLPLIPVALGIFAIPEIIEMMIHKRTISSKITVEGGAMAGFADTKKHWWLVVRCSILGGVCGIIPGLGGPVAEWMGYGHAVQSAKDKSKFGKGDIRGVIAAETATTAQKPGAIIPTVALGVPGNPAMALMLGVFLIVGLRPGEAMLNEHLPLTFQMLWTIIIANLIVAVICLLFQKQLVKICLARPTIVAPVILSFMTVGATFATNHFGDLLIFALFGALGYFFKSYDWPRVPVLIGMVLGQLAESYFCITIQIYNISWLWTRPISMVIAAATIIVFLGNVRRSRSK